MTEQARTVGFRMRLKPSQAEEYRRRHDALWPELRKLLQAAGISDYRIFLDDESLSLFATLTLAPGGSLEHLPEEPVMRRWWAHMADIMETEEDGAPASLPLRLMFHLA